MVTIALIGPDGAGKTTIGRRLEQVSPIPIKYIYMGDNADTSNYLLPTTRWNIAIKRALGRKPMHGARAIRRASRRPRGPVRRAVAGLKAGLGLANRLCEEWYRQGMAWYYQRRGQIVLFDRHFFADYYTQDIANHDHDQPLTWRIHALVLAHLYPKPDLVIYLDAPAEVLLARKGEGTLDLLERRRQDYQQLREVFCNFVTVDATQPEDEVVQAVAEVIRTFAAARGESHRGA